MEQNTKDAENAAALAAGDIQANWNSIFKTMDHWVKEGSQQKLPADMVQLAGQARYFSHKYLEFLSGVSFEADEADEFSRTKLRNQALDKVLEEWDTIRHALEQRENPYYQGVLLDLDKLAVECLSPLFDEAKIQRGIFAYFHKLFDIKRFIFSRTPLIGAPFSALHAPEDWLAIPHEAGHYIFWNGTDTFAAFNEFYLALQNQYVNAISKGLADRITGNVFYHKGAIFQIWLNWLNEIFADIFGTLVAGPAFAWSIQSQLRARLTVRDLLHSHEEADHPDPFIRPFFHIQTLREMASASEQAFAEVLNREADLLESSWKTSWASANGKVPEDAFRAFITKLPTPDSIGSMEQVLQQDIPSVVSVILNAKLGENLPYTLREYFSKGSLYNSGLHKQVLELVERIRSSERVTIESPLMRCIAARLAIVSGMDPIDVHVVLGYPGREESPATNDALEREFKEFLANVTGEKTIEGQRKAFRRILNYSLEEQAFIGGHHHPHSH